ncbi:hypothetical protein BHE74_00008030 [Ensete ventricosum]|nr:hypothetical protein BHE74_00008030 [Ensete ventricosum]
MDPFKTIPSSLPNHLSTQCVVFLLLVQNCRNLQDQVETLGRRSKWLKICMDEQNVSEDGLRNAMELKTCIGKTSELQRALHDRRGKREKVKCHRYLARSSC